MGRTSGFFCFSGSSTVLTKAVGGEAGDRQESDGQGARLGGGDFEGVG
jgi:hypothetical protein